MGGDDSQKLLPWRGSTSSPGPKPPAYYEFNTVAENCAGWGTCRPSSAQASRGNGPQLQTHWVTFGKQTWVTSPVRRRTASAN